MCAVAAVVGRQENCDPFQLELYLNDASFKELFGMSKAELEAVPMWRRRTLKERYGLI